VLHALDRSAFSGGGFSAFTILEGGCLGYWISVMLQLAWSVITHQNLEDLEDYDCVWEKPAGL
jgi:hypothetical protein